METIKELLEISVNIVKLISVIVLLVGLASYLKDLFINILKKDSKQIKIIKNKLGGIVLIGLEILIIADIVETIISPTFRDIGLLGAIVIIRTAISYFLNKEIESTN
ncbi:DUF1622 domain-containing protein [Miniphocaeibacter massiliensis]|uniref:DUF1622 domain-containing protein n=1 Tax=Miniphocaeibacter massiliensis TaxID=2041841 RepID=UPI001F5CF960|nr:DUF1622 domain-containing protein [Miniphocaeibacter massiliensis]